MEEKSALKLEKLLHEVEGLQKIIRECHHQFSEPMSFNRQITTPVFRCYTGKGSDPEPVFDYIPTTETAWQRSCLICGYTESTIKSKPVIRGFEPDFGGQ